MNNSTTHWLPVAAYDNSDIGNIMSMASCSNGDNGPSINCPGDIFNDKQPEIITDITKVKECVLKILHKQSDYTDEEYDEYNYENEEIDKLVKQTDKIVKEFEKVQQEIYDVDKQLTEEIKNINNTITKLDTMIEFLIKLDVDSDNILMKEIVEKIKNLSDVISKTEKFEKIKGNYVQKRKKLNKHIYFLRKINRFNICNMCPICLDNTVDHFIDPCGHTMCKNCIEGSIRMNTGLQDNIDIYSIRIDNTQCPLCRVPIHRAKSLFLL